MFLRKKPRLLDNLDRHRLSERVDARDKPISYKPFYARKAAIFKQFGSAAVASRVQKEFNALSFARSLYGRVPIIIGRARGSRLWRFSPSEKMRKTRQRGKRYIRAVCIYTLRKQLYPRAYQRPLFMSSSRPSSTRRPPPPSTPVISLALFLSPFRHRLFSPRIIGRQRCFYGRRISMASLKEDPWSNDVGRQDPYEGGKEGRWGPA